MIKTRQIELKPVGADSTEKKRKTEYVKNLATTLAKIGNEVIRNHVRNQYDIHELTDNKNLTKAEAKKYVEEILGTSIRNSGYQLTSKYPQIPSEIRSGISSVIFKTIENNFYDIINAKMSIPSFTKTNIPIPFSSKINKETNITSVITCVDDKYFLKFPCIDKSFPNMDFNLFFGKDKSKNIVIVKKILAGHYKLCDSSISYKENNKIILNLTYSFEPIKNNDIIPTRIMGIDVGMNKLVTFHISDIKYQPKQIEIGLKIHHDRMKFANTRKRLQKSLKYNNGGHGLKNKTKQLEMIKDKEKNYFKNINHVVSKEIINIAKKYKVGVIKLEDLSGITENSDNALIKTWKYYELQSFIKYKAEEADIIVLWVDPKNTSITCPQCGNIDKENRNDTDKTIFKCTNPLCEHFDIIKDADIVGAYNITYTHGEIIKSKSKKGIMEKGKKNKQLELNPS